MRGISMTRMRTRWTRERTLASAPKCTTSKTAWCNRTASHLCSRAMEFVYKRRSGVQRGRT
jgi:hypothetical protein